MKRVSIFGGSFNPPHLAHARIAESAAVQFQLDEVCWIPAGKPPHKTITGISTSDRMAMTRLATGKSDLFSSSSIEVERDGPSFTVDTLRALAEQLPDTQLFLLIGQDSLADFSAWRQPAQILQLARLIVYPRFADPSEATILGDIQMDAGIPGERSWSALRGELLPISSSDIRRRVRHHESIAHLVEPEVYSYIESHGLYLPR